MQLFDNWYFSMKLQWEVIDMWNAFSQLLILDLHLKLSCNLFEFWIFFWYSNVLLWRFFPLGLSSVPFCNSYKNSTEKCVTSHALHHSFLKLLLCNSNGKYIYYNCTNYFCSSHLYFKIVLLFLQSLINFVPFYPTLIIQKSSLEAYVTVKFSSWCWKWKGINSKGLPHL